MVVPREAAQRFVNHLESFLSPDFLCVADHAAFALDSILYARILPLPAEWIDAEAQQEKEK